MQTEQIIEALHNETLDMSILSTPLESPTLREIHLYQEPFLLYSKDQSQFNSLEKVSQDDLTPENLLLLEEGHCFRNQVLNICKINKDSKNKGLIFESGSIQTIKSLVKAGLGYSLVPLLSVQGFEDKKYSTAFKNPTPTREISIVINKNFTKEKLVEGLLVSIKKNIPNNLKELDNYLKVRWKP